VPRRPAKKIHSIFIFFIFEEADTYDKPVQRRCEIRGDAVVVAYGKAKGLAPQRENKVAIAVELEHSDGVLRGESGVGGQVRKAGKRESTGAIRKLAIPVLQNILRNDNLARRRAVVRVRWLPALEGLRAIVVASLDPVLAAKLAHALVRSVDYQAHDALHSAKLGIDNGSAVGDAVVSEDKREQARNNVVIWSAWLGQRQTLEGASGDIVVIVVCQNAAVL